MKNREFNPFAAPKVPAKQQAAAQQSKVPVVHSTETFIAVTIILIVITIAGFYLPPMWKVLIFTTGIGMIFMAIGSTVAGQALGFLINENNLMSLSRLQLSIWTIVIVASYGSYAFTRLHMVYPPEKDAWTPLVITIDSSILVLLGISAGSFVASPAISSTQKNKVPDVGVVAQTAQATGDTTAEVDSNRDGLLYANTNISDARFTDIFQGDEIGNTTQVDLAKVQMFLFTAVTAIGYLVCVIKDLRHASNPEALPKIPEQLNGILGISHLGYLGSRGITHTAVAKPQSPSG
jgi:hypothetical protein